MTVLPNPPYPTEQDFPDVLKNWQTLWERCIGAEGTTSRVMVASRPRITFGPGNYGWLFVDYLPFWLGRPVASFGLEIQRAECFQ
jgi:hypothetical protein